MSTQYKADTDRDLRIGDLILTVVDRASSAQAWVAHICTVVGYSGKKTDRVQVEPLCGVRGGMSSLREPLRQCQRCATAALGQAGRRTPTVWEEVVTASGEPPRYVEVWAELPTPPSSKGTTTRLQWFP